MAILIENMEMPKYCYECLTIGLDFENCPLNKSESADANTWMRCDHRHPDCPIVGEIPDKHGDLIDRDKFLEKAKKWSLKVTMTDKEGNVIAVKVIPYIELFSDLKNEPVVLEANKNDPAKKTS